MLECCEKCFLFVVLTAPEDEGLYISRLRLFSSLVYIDAETSASSLCCSWVTMMSGVPRGAVTREVL